MRIVIVGIGKVGRALAEHLSREGHDVAVIDNRPGMAERLAEELDVLGIEGNGAAYTVQQQARASQADLVIAATSEDEVNMIACMTAKKLGAKNTIARGAQRGIRKSAAIHAAGDGAFSFYQPGAGDCP